MLVQQAPFIHADEIEKLVELELTASGLFPTIENPIVEIETFIERHLGAQLEQYVDLDDDVLGVTYFFPDRPPHVQINRNLAEAADDVHAPTWYHGRLRSTMAHEAGHILLHRNLFDFETQQGSLWDGYDSRETNARCQRCLKRDATQATAGRVDRREYQANIAMAALLMPRRVFEATAFSVLEGWGITDAVRESEQVSLRLKLTSELGERFKVSRQACEIRMKTLDINKLLSQARLLAR